MADLEDRSRRIIGVLWTVVVALVTLVITGVVSVGWQIVMRFFLWK